MSDPRDWDALNNAQCPELFAGWQCIREPGHGGEHRSRAVGPGMIGVRPISTPEPVTYISAERAILQDLIAELRSLNQNRDGGMWADDVHDAADRAEARLREVTA